MMKKIGFLYKNKLVRKVRIEPGLGVLMIGRSSTAEICLPLENISGFHAQLLMDDRGQLFLIDQNSTNGSFVNGVRLSPGVPTHFSENDNVVLAKSESVVIVFNPDQYSSGEISGKLYQSSDDTKASTNLMSRLREKQLVVIGRESDCDLQLDHGNVSRRHALVRQEGPDLFSITDLSSLNGTFVNGRRINGTVTLNENDLVLIGRFRLTLKGATRDLSNEKIAIRATKISKVFPGGKVGLHELSMEVPANSMLAVMGPSGCGKSTLLKSLNGVSPPSFGSVHISGLELSEHFDYLKTQIGYVPQDDIVHRELTVEQSLRYSAKLRMENFTNEQINEKIDQVLETLKINHIRHQMVANISGGQRKRVSIAVEVLNQPMILFLDEPTSPLDPQTIEDFLSSLRRLCEQGTTIVIVTHKPEDLNYVDNVIFMAEGGYMAYSGSSKNYLSYFQVADVTKVYSNLAGERAQVWINKIKNQNTASSGPPISSSPTGYRPSVNYFRQYWWLTMRYFNIKFNDKMNSMIMIGQAPLIALLICLTYEDIELSVLFFMTVSALWLGTSNAAREIVAELPIYIRERMYNLGILPYLFSKITVLGFFAALQSALFTLIITTRFLGNDLLQWKNPLHTFVWMLGISITASLMGLLLSAIFNTTEKVISAVPIALLPQIILAGVVAKITNPLVEILSYLTISRWGTEGMANLQKDVVVPPAGTMEKHVGGASQMLGRQFHSTYEKTFGTWHGQMKLDAVMLVSIALALFIALILVLKRKDTIKIK
jgi:ABC-type multidrug transport system ATPase subunit/pSer/pThr/pTyr-binding forkhead associated (FHA) protein/ABC-type multidrug transport system permease subunit